MDDKVQIENMFYEAEANMDKDPNEALTQFQTVIEMEEQEQECNYQFKAVKNIIAINAQKKNVEEARAKLKKLLKLCPKVAQNEARDTLGYVLDLLTKCFDPGMMQDIYQEIVGQLKGSNKKLWQSVCTRLCRMYLEKKMYKELDKLANELKDSMRGPGGAYDEKKGSPFEVLALQMQMYIEMKDIKKLKELDSETVGLSGVVTDAKVNAMLKECNAIILLSERNWEEAQASLLESFKSYQQMANSKAKQILKVLLVTSMVSGSEIDPMTLTESKVYQDDSEIQPLARLRKAFQDNKITELKQIMATNGKKLSSDKAIAEYSGDFFKAIKQKIIIEKISSYSTVSIKYLAQDLAVSDKDMMAMLVELILDERINGKIDESKGFLELSSSEKNILDKKRCIAIEQMSRTLNIMFTGIIDAVPS
jgi:COP9 signalosome complex subunit 2